MVVAAFPIAKLASLAFRQLSKPLANRIKRSAKSSHFFRTYVCMPPAQLYHWVEVNVKMRILNLGKPSEVPPLNEAMAIELGSELLGEIIVFASAAATLIAEYMRQSRNERLREAAKNEKYNCLECEVEELRMLVRHHDVQIKHLTRLAGTFVVAPPPPPVDSSGAGSSGQSTQGGATEAKGAGSSGQSTQGSASEVKGAGSAEVKATPVTTDALTVVGRASDEATARLLGKTLS